MRYGGHSGDAAHQHFLRVYVNVRRAGLSNHVPSVAPDRERPSGDSDTCLDFWWSVHAAD